MSVTWWQPSPGLSWQWQLTGKLNTNIQADVYDVDVAGGDTTNVYAVKSVDPNRKVICYVNVGSLETDGSRSDQDQFQPSDLGSRYPGWPDEVFVDIRSSNVRRIMQARFQVMQQAGCDAIEPDNMALDYKGNGGFSTAITEADQVDYINWFTGSIHELGLAIGAKNGGDLISKHPELYSVFDFAVVEECARNKDCGKYTPFVEAGKPVFAADYLDAGSDGGCSPIKGSVEAAKVVLNDHGFEGILKNCKLDAKVIPCKSYTPSPPASETTTTTTTTKAYIPSPSPAKTSDVAPETTTTTATTKYIPSPPSPAQTSVVVSATSYVRPPPVQTSDAAPVTTYAPPPVQTSSYAPQPPAKSTNPAGNFPTASYVPPQPTVQTTSNAVPAGNVPTTTTTITTCTSPKPAVTTNIPAVTQLAATTTIAVTSAQPPAPITPATTKPVVYTAPPADNKPATTTKGGILASIPALVYDIDIAGGDGANIAAVKAVDSNRRVICYVNVGSLELNNQRADQNQFLASDLGNGCGFKKVAYTDSLTQQKDPGWPNEVFIDIRSSNVRRIMQSRFQAMKNGGCDAIEPDNMVIVYKGNSGFSPGISESDQVDYMNWFTGTIHSLGLAVAAKNGGDILTKYPSLFNVFDFAVVEECAANNDCGVFSPFVNMGKPVFAADYTSSGSGGCVSIKGSVQAACDRLNSYNFEGIIKSCNLNAGVTQCRAQGPLNPPPPPPPPPPPVVVDPSPTPVTSGDPGLPPPPPVVVNPTPVLPADPGSPPPLTQPTQEPAGIIISPSSSFNNPTGTGGLLATETVSKTVSSTSVVPQPTNNNKAAPEFMGVSTTKSSNGGTRFGVLKALVVIASAFVFVFWI
ncbi:UNVERIFIED_CONTAM: hypothetical protein HDU68_006759 [Siphonaria sp. JEL0065]|nr:hypothetical protein HDU68_006759 [Siphonaria sp. JEL0065]